MSEVTITIDESGNLIFLDTASAQAFKELGTVTTRRASHVEPFKFWARLAFSVIRRLVADDSPTAEWTRNWDCRWRIDTRPVGGRVLQLRDVHDWCGCKEVAGFSNRDGAIIAEIKFLNEFFLRRTR
jgi:hypothetical protein